MNQCINDAYLVLPKWKMKQIRRESSLTYQYSSKNTTEDQRHNIREQRRLAADYGKAMVVISLCFFWFFFNSLLADNFGNIDKPHLRMYILRYFFNMIDTTNRI